MVVADVRADGDTLDASRLALQLDFVLLTLYGLTFVLLGLLLVGRGRRWATAGVALIAGAILTCVLDVVENVLTLRLIPADGQEAATGSALDALTDRVVREVDGERADCWSGHAPLCRP